MEIHRYRFLFFLADKREDILYNKKINVQEEDHDETL